MLCPETVMENTMFIAGSFLGMPLPDPPEVAAERSKEISLGIMSPILHGRCPGKGVNINISAGISGQPSRQLLSPLQTFFAATKRPQWLGGRVRYPRQQTFNISYFR
jgi:hypothetical protein